MNKLKIDFKHNSLKFTCKFMREMKKEELFLNDLFKYDIKATFTDCKHASYQKHGDIQCSISVHCQLGSYSYIWLGLQGCFYSTILEVYNSSMDIVGIEEIVHLKSIKVVKSKINAGSEIV